MKSGHFLARTALIAVACCGNAAWAQSSTQDVKPAPTPATDGAPSAPGPAASPNATAVKANSNEIVVTGSRIRGVAPVGANLITVSNTEIQNTPATNLPDLLRRVPQVSALGFDESAKNGVGPGAPTTNSTRASTVNLRGLGPQATLAMINGERIATAGAAGGVADPSVIPTIALERVEVLADGASAIYGSDAVAGVVNFITRKRYDGAETRARYSVADGQNRWDLAQLIGKDWGSGSAVLAIEYFHQSELSGTERSFVRSNLTAEGGRDYRDVQCDPGNIVIGGVSYAISADGVTPATASHLVPGINHCENYALADLIPKTTRKQAYLSVTQELTDNLEIYVRGAYSRRNYEIRDGVQGSTTELATTTLPSTNAYFVAPAGVTPPVCTAAQLAAFRAPAGTRCETVQYSFVNTHGLLDFLGSSENMMVSGGAALKLGGDWRANFDAHWALDNDKLTVNGITTAALNPALASSNPATALDVFSGRTSQSVIDGIFTNLFYPYSRTTVQTYRLSANGSLFELPAGNVRLAFGAEHRRDYFGAGNVRGAPGAQTKAFSAVTQKVDSLYGELYVPIVGASNSFTAVQKLELSLAGRIDRYSDVGTTRNPKLGLTWKPIRDLSLKGTYGTSFRAPSPASLQLLNPTAGLYVVTIPDPLSATGTSVGIVNFAGNPGLKPETSKTFTATAEVTPVSVPGLTFSATYFWLNYNNQILGANQNTLLTDPNSALRVFRPTAAQVAAYLASFPNVPVIGVLPPTVAFIGDLRAQNQGGTKVRGIDFLASYGFGSAFGHWDVGGNATIYNKFAVSFAPGAVFTDLTGYIGYPTKFRGRCYLDWSLRSLSVEAYLNYTAGYNNNNVTPIERVKAYTTVDLGVGYEFKSSSPWLNGLSVNIRADNLFNRDPPYVNIQGGYDPSGASAVGRLVSFTVDKKF